MILILSILLVFSIGLNLFPPKKPNYLFGYQLGSSKKSLEHWKVANKYASSYLILLYSLTIILSIIEYKQKLDLHHQKGDTLGANECLKGISEEEEEIAPSGMDMYWDGDINDVDYEISLGGIVELKIEVGEYSTSINE